MTTAKVLESYRTAGFTDTDPKAAGEGYSEYLTWLPAARDSQILDLGCGGGEFLEYLESQGYTNLEGIDFSGEQVARCHERGLRSVTQVPDAHEYLASRPRAFDCIVLNDVLEHIPKAGCITLLEKIHASLKDGGACIIKVPNAANVFGLVARYLDFTHEIAFTETSLRQVLRTAGFRDIDVLGLPVRFRLSPKRIVYWGMNRAYLAAHRIAYVAAVGSDAPTILTKLIVARAKKTPASAGP